MRLILNKELDNINNNVNIKVIEVTSTDFLNNNLDYFVYKYQIPLIKFTDTEEIFNIKNFKSELSSSLSETEIILEESDLELISGGGSGGSQDLQSVIDKGGVAINYDNSNSSYVEFHQSGKEYPAPQLYLKSVISDSESIINLFGGKIALQQENQDGYTKIVFNDPTSLTSLYFPSKPANGEYTLATLDDILNINLDSRVYANNAAAITGGLVAKDLYRTATGEIRIVV